MVSTEDQLVGIVRDHFPGCEISSAWLSGSLLGITVRLGVRDALGPWGVKVDAAREAVCTATTEINAGLEPGWTKIDSMVSLRFTKPAALVFKAASGLAHVAEALLS